VKIPGLLGNSATCGEAWLGGVRSSWARQMCHVDHLSPPPMVDHLICRERYKYWVLRNNSSVYSDAVTQSCDRQVLTTSSSSSSSSTSSHFFFLSWESWTFLGCHYAGFPARPLPGHHENNLIWVYSSLMVPLWASLVLSAFGRLSGGPASRLTVTKTIWSEWTRSVLLGLQ
jgi:hypothetical protein